MSIPPGSINQDVASIELSEQLDGVSITMRDPVTDFESALSAVTLAHDLSGAVSARL